MSTVLICEDDPLLALDLAQNVEDAGHQLHGVYSTAEAALSESKTVMPDTAIIDLALADGETGAMLARTLQLSGVRVIIVSGHSNVNAGLDSVPHTFASKPLTSELVDLLLQTLPPA